MIASKFCTHLTALQVVREPLSVIVALALRALQLTDHADQLVRAANDWAERLVRRCPVVDARQAHPFELLLHRPREEITRDTAHADSSNNDGRAGKKRRRGKKKETLMMTAGDLIS